MSTGRSPKRYYVAAAVALVTIMVHAQALKSGFVNWDDDLYVYANVHIRSLSERFLWWALTDSTASGFWHPVTWMSHAVDYALWGLKPAGHHLTSVLLHGVNAYLVVLLISALVAAARSTRGQEGEGSPHDEHAVLITAAITGVLFGIHPLRVESVAWVSERKDLLYAFFTLLGLLAYLRYAAGTSGDGARSFPLSRRAARYLLVLVLSLLAMASKPMAVTFPAVLLILDWFPLRRMRSGRDVLALAGEKVPFLAVSLAVSAVTIMAQRTAGGMMSVGAFPLAARILVACRSLVLYLGKMIWPLGLHPLYLEGMDATFLSPGTVLCVVLVIAATAAAIRSAATQRLWLSVWAFYVVTLLPVLGLLQDGSQVMADRFTYLPALGPFLLVGLAGTRVWVLAGRVPWRDRGARQAVLAAAAVIVVALAFLTVRQAALWKDSVRFWTVVIDRNPSSLAYTNRGIAYAQAGQPDLALADYDAALERDADGPYAYLAYTNRGALLLERGDPAHALSDLNRAVGLNPAYPPAYDNRGLVWINLKRHADAIEDFSRAVSLDPADTAALLNRGALFGETGSYDRALRDYDAVLALDPGNAGAHTLRGMAHKMQGRFVEALEDYGKAIELDPSSAEAYNNRGVVYKHLGQLELALANYTRALSLKPSFALAYCNRGVVLGMLEHADEAIGDFSTAVFLNPDQANAYLERGRLYQARGDAALARRDYQRACQLGIGEACAAARVR